MAVIKTSAGRKRFNMLVKSMGADAEDRITRKVTDITEARKGDNNVNIRISGHQTRPRLFTIGVFKKGEDAIITDNGQSFFHIFSTSGVNAEKARAMRAPL